MQTERPPAEGRRTVNLKRMGSAPLEVENIQSSHKKREQAANESLAYQLMKVLKTEKRKRDVATVPDPIRFTKQLSVTVTASRKMSALDADVAVEEKKNNKAAVMARPESKQKVSK